MEPELWQRVEQVCMAALDRGEEERGAYVAAACAGDAALEREVKSLLAEQSRADSFMESPAIEIAAKGLAEEAAMQCASSMIGRTISHYRIVEKLGAGGMGEVYRADRADGAYEKQVAVKLIRSGFGSEYFLDRFRNERQILARLDHPGIARLLDGGATEDGLPFIVMEYVDGIPIDQYCEKLRLSVPERLKLFRDVCLAVQYAHQNLVLHRDLKPGNILVTSSGEVKLLDFGIAKITDADENHLASAAQATVLPMMTPEFASPEQVRNEAMTTASDIYSLGVILYKLLCGRLPFRTEGTAPHEVARAICETDPAKPSSVIPDVSSAGVAAAGRKQDSFGAKIASDLDNIVLKALRKEPLRRYGSAEQLSEDIRRYLEGRPVLAHKDTLRYRAGKFVRREKKIVTAAMLVVLSLTGGLIAATWEAHLAQIQRARAERRFNDVRSLANSLMFDVNDAIRGLPGSTAARELVVSKALTYLDSLAQEANGDLSFQRELATAYERVGEVQGAFDSANVGDTAQALSSLKKAVAIRQSIAAEEHSSHDSLTSLANTYEMLGLMLSSSGDYQEALDYAQKAVQIEEGFGSAPNAAADQEALAGSYYVLGVGQHDLAGFQDSLASLRKSVAIRETIATTDPDLYAQVRTRLSGTYGEIGTVLSEMGRPADAIAATRQGLDVMSALAAAHPKDRLFKEYVFEHTDVIASYFEQMGDHTQAEGYYEKAQAGFTATSASDPNDTNSKLWLGVCDSELGKVQVELGEFVPGMENIRAGLEIALALYQADPSENTDKLPNVASAYAASGFAFAHMAEQPGIAAGERLRDWKQAQAQYQKSRNTWQQVEKIHKLQPRDASDAAKATQELAEADASLAKLTASR
ncbi:MAG TPA: serine/threonine-protein kinase [Candidatus Acidoferrales bacterium]|nr:serine/threonine-protein kinase [Candidatus Acidoferrales bacterium]